MHILFYEQAVYERGTKMIQVCFNLVCGGVNKLYGKVMFQWQGKRTPIAGRGDKVYTVQR